MDPAPQKQSYTFEHPHSHALLISSPWLSCISAVGLQPTAAPKQEAAFGVRGISLRIHPSHRDSKAWDMRECYNSDKVSTPWEHHDQRRRIGACNPREHHPPSCGTHHARLVACNHRPRHRAEVHEWGLVEVGGRPFCGWREQSQPEGAA